MLSWELSYWANKVDDKVLVEMPHDVKPLKLINNKHVFKKKK